MISEKEKFFDPRKPFQSARPETHEEWQARMGGEVLAVVRSGLYLDFRFLDQALSALTPTADERCGVLATDGTILCYQPSALLRRGANALHDLLALGDGLGLGENGAGAERHGKSGTDGGADEH